MHARMYVCMYVCIYIHIQENISQFRESFYDTQFKHYTIFIKFRSIYLHNSLKSFPEIRRQMKERQCR